MKIAELLQMLTPEEEDRLLAALKISPTGIDYTRPVTVGLAQYVYDAFGIIYDFRIKRFYRESTVRIITEEELNKVVDQYL